MVIDVIRPPFFVTPFAAVEPLVAIDGDLMLPDEILEDLLGDVRLEDPHRALRAVDGRRALPLVAVLLALLPLPRLGLVVVLPDAVVELARQAADDRLVAGVGEPEAAARQPAEMPVRADDDDASCPAALPAPRQSRRLSAAVDDDVELRPRRRLRTWAVAGQRKNVRSGSGSFRSFTVHTSKSILSARRASANADS